MNSQLGPKVMSESQSGPKIPWAQIPGTRQNNVLSADVSKILMDGTVTIVNKGAPTNTDSCVTIILKEYFTEKSCSDVSDFSVFLVITE